MSLNIFIGGKDRKLRIEKSYYQNEFKQEIKALGFQV